MEEEVQTDESDDERGVRSRRQEVPEENSEPKKESQKRLYRRRN